MEHKAVKDLSDVQKEGFALGLVIDDTKTIYFSNTHWDEEQMDLVRKILIDKYTYSPSNTSLQQIKTLDPETIVRLM